MHSLHNLYRSFAPSWPQWKAHLQPPLCSLLVARYNLAFPGDCVILCVCRDLETNRDFARHQPLLWLYQGLQLTTTNRHRLKSLVFARCPIGDSVAEVIFGCLARLEIASLDMRCTLLSPSAGQSLSKVIGASTACKLQNLNRELPGLDLHISFS